MKTVKVYRNIGDHNGTDLRTYRNSIEHTIKTTDNEDFREGSKKGLELLREFGKAAPKEYDELWNGNNPILDSVYSYLSHPDKRELSRDDRWIELEIDPNRSVVAPHLLAGTIVALRKTSRVPEYWGMTHVLEDFLKKYKPLGPKRSDRRWKRIDARAVYEFPEVLIPLDAITDSRLMTKEE